MNSRTYVQSELTIAWHNAGATCLLPVTKQLFVEKRVQSITVYPQMSAMENSVAFCEKAMQFLDNDQFEESPIYFNAWFWAYTIKKSGGFFPRITHIKLL